MGLLDFLKPKPKPKPIDEKDFDAAVKRNAEGIELEQAGRIDEAIALYEMNVAADFIGGHPYNRLAILYRKRKEYDKEIAVLEKRIAVLRAYVLPEFNKGKIRKAEERLARAKELKAKKAGN